MFSFEETFSTAFASISSAVLRLFACSLFSLLNSFLISASASLSSRERSRFRISWAALRLNARINISDGATRQWRMRNSVRVTRVVVFPLPALAVTCVCS